MEVAPLLPRKMIAFAALKSQQYLFCKDSNRHSKCHNQICIPSQDFPKEEEEEQCVCVFFFFKKNQFQRKLFEEKGFGLQ